MLFKCCKVYSQPGPRSWIPRTKHRHALPARRVINQVKPQCELSLSHGHRSSRHYPYTGYECLHSLPATTHRAPSSLFAIDPPPFVVARGRRTWRVGPRYPCCLESEKISGRVKLKPPLLFTDERRFEVPAPERSMCDYLKAAASQTSKCASP